MDSLSGSIFDFKAAKTIGNINWINRISLERFSGRLSMDILPSSLW